MISRRLLLQRGTTATALAGIGVLPMDAPATEAPDPCLAFVDAWNDAEAHRWTIKGSEGEAFWDEHCDPYERASHEGCNPRATTAAGAAAALRKALSFDLQDQEANLIGAALAFLERGSRT